MKRKEFLGDIMLGSLGLASIGSFVGEFTKHSSESNENNPRRRLLFNRDWRFHLGDVKGGQKPNLNDQSWRKLDVPHDWSIEGKFSEKYATTDGEADLPGGIGWYRKSFKIPKPKRGKFFFIEFGGVYEDSDVWINGHHLGSRPYGYSTFRYNMTPYLHYGSKENEIAVRVDNSKQPNSRWYSGSGIFRNVYLIETQPIHVDQWGTFVSTPFINTKFASVRVETKIKNETQHDVSVSLKTVIFNPDGEKVAEESHSTMIKGQTTAEVSKVTKIQNPTLWSVEHPELYKAVSVIEQDGKKLDHYETPFGIRYFRFDADSGFYLNGEPLKIRGVCDHHNCLGPLGSAQNTRAILRKLQILKEMGCNGIRCSHNPPTPVLLDLADRMGFIVMDEAFDCWSRPKVRYDYHLHWDEWHKRDLEDMIRRDRNHPSIFLWSIGNEIIEQVYPEGRKIAPELAGIVRDLDSTRPITSGCDELPPGEKNNYIIQSGALDVVGINYNYGITEDLTELFPGQKFIFSETTSALATRGHYDMPADEVRVWPTENGKGMNSDYTCSSYDNCRVPWGSTHEKNLRLMHENDYLSGMYLWTGFDYLGEPTPYGWPARSSYFGILDLCGIPKDAFYLYQSQWTEKPVLHLFPHWNWNEAQKVDVWAYTNCDDVELFLNGKSLGTRYFDRRDKLHLSWDVSFEPGTLKAVGMKNGQVVLTREVKTAGKASQIRLTPDRSEIHADGQDLSYVTVDVLDEDGTLVPHAHPMINFEVSGPGKIAAIGNGKQTGHVSLLDSKQRAFNGKCMAILQSDGSKGRIKLKAASEGLRSGVVSIKAV